MKRYRALAVERTMKVQEVILRAMSGEILWMQAAETERPYRIFGMHAAEHAAVETAV